MSKEKITTLTTRELCAIVRSASPDDAQFEWAREELVRRAQARAALSLARGES